jgi:4-carboxymuconolactone decarboxylase
MARINPIPRQDMSEEQIRVNDEIAGVRSGDHARGPFAIWLRTPELAEKIGAFGIHLRTQSALPRRLFELAVLTTARTWTAQYEWYAHSQFVELAELDPAMVEEIRLGRKPAFTQADEEIIYDVVMEMSETRRLTDETYEKAVRILGEQTVVDLLTVIGYYTMIAVVLVGLEVDTPDGTTPLPPVSG